MQEGRSARGKTDVLATGGFAGAGPSWLARAVSRRQPFRRGDAELLHSARIDLRLLTRSEASARFDPRVEVC